MPEYYGPAFGPQGQQFSNPNVLDYNNAISNYQQTGNASSVNNVLSAFNQIPGNQAYNAPNVQNRTQAVLGASTGGGGGGTSSHINPATGQWDDNYFAQAQNAANSGNNALLSQLNTQYDQNASNLNSQLSDLGTQKNNSLNELNTTYQGLSDQTNTQKTQANQNLQDQIAQAGSQAHSTQNANRNTLRALGILNSTAAGEQLSKPLTAFDQQRAQLQTQTNQRLSQLDDFMNNQASVHANAVKSLEDQYGSLVGKIQSDLRFNDRQRSDAIQSANAALQQRMAEIQNSLFNYQTQVQTAKQQAATQLSQLQSYQNPTYDPNAIVSQILSPDQGQQSQTVGIAQDPNKNNPLLSG